MYCYTKAEWNAALDQIEDGACIRNVWSQDVPHFIGVKNGCRDGFTCTPGWYETSGSDWKNATIINKKEDGVLNYDNLSRVTESLSNQSPNYWHLPETGFSTSIKLKKSLMSKITTMFKKLLDSDTQSLVEAGLIMENLELSDEGENQLQAILFEQNKAALVAIAKEKLATAKK